MRNKKKRAKRVPVLARLGMTAQSFTDNGQVYGPIIGMGEEYCVFKIAGGDVGRGSTDLDGVGRFIARPWHHIELIDAQPDPAELQKGADHA